MISDSGLIVISWIVISGTVITMPRIPGACRSGLSSSSRGVTSPSSSDAAVGLGRVCALYQRWRGKQNVALRQEHQPGEKGFVDWAGATIPVHDPVTGDVWPAPLFVMVQAPVPIPMPKPTKISS